MIDNIMANDYLVREQARQDAITGAMNIYYTGAVERGVALLDKAKPDWARRIDLPTLDLGNIKFCMLGQIYGDFGDGREKLSETLTKLRIEFEDAGNYDHALKPEYYGFEALSRDPDNTGTPWTHGQGYSILTEMWTRIIADRRALGTTNRDQKGRFSKRA
jgi:hypothetical protein